MTSSPDSPKKRGGNRSARPAGLGSGRAWILVPLLALIPALRGESPPQTTGKDAFPLALDREHRFSWVLDRRKVGETKFRITEVEAPTGSPWKKIYRSTAQYRYEREGITLSGTHESYFDPSWKPIRYRQTHEYRGLRGTRSSQEQMGEVMKGHLSYTVVHDQNQNAPVRQDMEVPAEAFLLLNQAVDNWAILFANLLRRPDAAEAKVVYPDLLAVYQLRFRFEKEEALDLPGKPSCRAFSFRSSEGILDGRAWVDSAGRLIQYQQGSLRIYREDEAPSVSPAGPPPR